MLYLNKTKIDIVYFQLHTWADNQNQDFFLWHPLHSPRCYNVVYPPTYYFTLQLKNVLSALTMAIESRAAVTTCALSYHLSFHFIIVTTELTGQDRYSFPYRITQLLISIGLHDSAACCRLCSSVYLYLIHSFIIMYYLRHIFLSEFHSICIHWHSPFAPHLNTMQISNCPWLLQQASGIRES